MKHEEKIYETRREKSMTQEEKIYESLRKMYGT